MFSQVQKRVDLFPGMLQFFCVDSTGLRNIFGHTISKFTANPVRLTDMDVSEFFAIFPAPQVTLVLPRLASIVRMAQAKTLA